jgi:hypothetical protein
VAVDVSGAKKASELFSNSLFQPADESKDKPETKDKDAMQEEEEL